MTLCPWVEVKAIQAGTKVIKFTPVRPSLKEISWKASAYMPVFKVYFMKSPYQNFLVSIAYAK